MMLEGGGGDLAGGWEIPGPPPLPDLYETLHTSSRLHFGARR